MIISNKYVVVTKIVEEEKEGFQEVKIQDSSFYKGKIKLLPQVPVFMCDRQIVVGDVIVFSPYSPDTKDVEGDKFVLIDDILAVL